MPDRSMRDDRLTATVPAPPVRRSVTVAGVSVWVALFAVLAVESVWFVVFVAALAVSVMVHEYAHFWTARRAGMRVTQFFFGFGPKIWAVERVGVLCGMRAFPLGGFVKIIGMTGLDDIDPADEPATYRHASWPRQLWVITAGSVIHLTVAAVLLCAINATWGHPEPSGTVRVVAVTAASPAAAAGLQPGDVIVSIDDQPVTTSDATHRILTAHTPGTTVAIVVERDGQTRTVHATLAAQPDAPAAGLLGIEDRSGTRAGQDIGQAVVSGVHDTLWAAGETVRGVARILNPVTIWGHLTGSNHDPATQPGTVIGATRVSDDVGTSFGWSGMLTLIALVNISLGVFNMVPMLPLDGGHAAFATYQRIRSRHGRRYRADIRKLQPVTAVFVVLLAFMFLTGAYLDIIH